MDLSPSLIHELRHFPLSLPPAIAKRRYGGRVKTRLPKAARHFKTRNQRTPRVGWDRDEGEDGRRLASDPTVALPGELWRPTPRLERQEAFRAPETWDISDTDVAVGDAELYRLGILYDDDDGNDLSLDTIVHTEPVYSLRPAKRTKRAHDGRLSLREDDLRLSVELLSTCLGDDAAIARFFTPVGDEERAQLQLNDFNGTDTQHNSSTARQSPAELLTIIYELTASPMHSPAPTPAASNFPDLISDTEDDEAETSFGGDWALVPDPRSNASLSSGDAAGFDTDVDVIIDHDEETTDPANGAWVFLAEDDS
ncbi:hypothetical protein GGS24DRAFT_231109 [Hypoxylon argillaceum]|nr:hypothetical protein GGS24DRAFT_231109 [Hypoxylon argillaceum]